ARHEPIDEIRARGPRPVHLVGERLRLRDLLAAFARQGAGVGIAEDGVWTIGLLRAVVRDPARGVGDIADQRLGHWSGKFCHVLSMTTRQDLPDSRASLAETRANHALSLAACRWQGDDGRMSRMSGEDAMKPAGVKLTYDDLLVLFPEDDGLRHELIDGEHYVTPCPNMK